MKDTVEVLIPKIEIDPLTDTLLSLMGTLKAERCESLVVIGINKTGEVISFRRGGSYPAPYAMIGALVAMERDILDREVESTKAVESNPTGEDGEKNPAGDHCDQD